MLWWIFATLCAYVSKGLTGLGDSLILTSMVGFTNINLDISPVSMLLGSSTNLIMIWDGRKTIDWKFCLPLCAIVVAGSIPGALLLKSVDARILKIIFGVVIIAVSLEMLFRRNNTKKPSPVFGGAIAVMAGLSCGMFGVGTMLGAYVARLIHDPKACKTNLCVIFAVETAVRFTTYLLTGILTMNAVKQALPLLPFVYIGLWAGMRISKVLDEKKARTVVLVMLIASGIGLIVNSL